MLDGCASTQHVSAALKLTWPTGDPAFAYRDYAESSTSGLSTEENQQISSTQSRGTEAILGELRAGGVRLAALLERPGRRPLCVG